MWFCSKPFGGRPTPNLVVSVPIVMSSLKRRIEKQKLIVVWPIGLGTKSNQFFGKISRPRPIAYLCYIKGIGLMTAPFMNSSHLKRYPSVSVILRTLFGNYP